MGCAQSTSDPQKLRDTVDISSSLTNEADTDQHLSTISDEADHNANDLTMAQKNTTYGTTTNFATETSVEDREGAGEGKRKRERAK